MSAVGMIQGLLHIDHIVALPIPSFELLKPPSRVFEVSMFDWSSLMLLCGFSGGLGFRVLFSNSTKICKNNMFNMGKVARSACAKGASFCVDDQTTELSQQMKDV